MKNKLIVIEGIDGVGKTSIAKELQQHLIMSGIHAVLYEELEKKNEGFNKIKPYIKKNAPLMSSLFFYLASAIKKSEVIRELLNSSWVICDRYVYSTIANHRAKGLTQETINKFNISELPIIKPDYLFLIVCNERQRLTRIARR